MNGEPSRQKELESIATRGIFRGIVQFYGIETIEDVLKETQEAVERGRNGVTVFAEYGVDPFGVSITSEVVSLQFVRGEVHSLTRQEADELLADIKREAETPPQ